MCSFCCAVQLLKRGPDVLAACAPDALEALTGSPQMDASAILDYFAPLKQWLDEQNASRQCGW